MLFHHSCNLFISVLTIINHFMWNSHTPFSWFSETRCSFSSKAEYPRLNRLLSEPPIRSAKCLVSTALLHSTAWTSKITLLICTPSYVFVGIICMNALQHHCIHKAQFSFSAALHCFYKIYKWTSLFLFLSSNCMSFLMKFHTCGINWFRFSPC